LRNALRESDWRKNRSYYEDILPVYLELICRDRSQTGLYFSPEEIEEMLSFLERFRQLGIFDGTKIKEAEQILASVTRNAVSRAPMDIRAATNSTNVVLIERSDDPLADSSVQSGIVYKLNLSSERLPGKEHKDLILFKSPIEGDDTELLEHLRMAVNVVKAILPSLKGDREMFSFTYFFDDQNYSYTGTSLGLPAACLAYNSILVNTLSKYYYKFRDDAVFTSEIDENGNLVKLDYESLKIKIQTVFYSRYRKLVLPEDNLIEAKEILNELVPSSGGVPEVRGGLDPSSGGVPEVRGGLDLIFLPNFQSVFKNLDLVERCELKFTDKLKVLYHRYHAAANWLLSILSLAVIAFFVIRFAIPRLDTNPETSGVENNRFAAYNQYGVKVWESSFTTVYTPKTDISNVCLVADIDGDTRREILVLNQSSKDSAERRKIYCFNPNGTLKWEYSKPAETLFYKGKLEPDNFTWAQIHLEDLDGDGKKELVAFGQLAGSFPAKLSIFSLPDAADSRSQTEDSRSQTPFGNEGIKEQAYYWHCGNIFCISFIDLNKDGRKEILCGGVSNLEGHRQGFMAVFDSRYLSGVSMNTDPFGDGRKGTEMYYILFPKTVFSGTIGHGDNLVLSITELSEGRIQVQVKEVGPGDETAPFILYFLDYNLNPIGMNPSNTFDARIKDYYSGDYRRYQDSLLHSIRFWTGDSLAAAPTRNKYYLEAIRHQK